MTFLHSVQQILFRMRQYGEPFESRLADAWIYASTRDSQKLEELFRELLEKFDREIY